MLFAVCTAGAILIGVLIGLAAGVASTMAITKIRNRKADQTPTS